MLLRARPLLELDRFGLMGYDQAAYFVGARALTLGYWPHRQFTQVQPPGILLLLAPFALARSAGGAPQVRRKGVRAYGLPRT